jgi:hypothetical protein
MNIEQLTGADLDFWTARAEGHQAELMAKHGMRYCQIDVYPTGHQFYQPTHNWLLAAAIAHARRYTQYPRLDRAADGGAVWVWIVEAQQNPQFHGQFVATDARFAICRLRVAEAAAEGALDIASIAVPHDPDDMLEQRAIATLSDEQAAMSFERWKNFRRHADTLAVQS